MTRTGVQEQKEFWSRITELLREKAMTSADLADRIGTSRATASGWKRRGSWPSGWSLVLISEALDCNIDWLLTGEGQPNRGAPAEGGTFSGAIARGALQALGEVESQVRTIRVRYQGVAAAARSPEGAQIERMLLGTQDVVSVVQAAEATEPVEAEEKDTKPAAGTRKRRGGRTD